MAVSGTGLGQRFFVHRWTATELAARQAGEQLAAAHRQAAAYWRWRYQAWPQDQAADMHGLLEARHHLLAAGDTDAATQITWPICKQLHTWGAWDQEAALIHDTLVRLPDRSADQARWLRQLGMVARTGAGTTTRPNASTSAPWTSANGSATRPTWPSATTGSASD